MGMPACLLKLSHAHTRIPMTIRVCMYLHIPLCSVCAHINACMHTRIHLRPCAYMYAHIHSCTRAFMRLHCAAGKSAGRCDALNRPAAHTSSLSVLSSELNLRYLL